MLLPLLPALALARKPPPPAPPPLEVVAETLLIRALSSSEAYEELGVLCDDIGHRLAGSTGLDRAIAWAQEELREDGLADVHTEPVTVRSWIRGEERLTQLAPRPIELDLLGLGNSVGTPPGGVEADVHVVGSLEELAANPEPARGKVVLFDLPFTTYGETVGVRFSGAAAASRAGAVAALVRSVTPVSLDTPHTGTLGYEDGVAPIPAAAVTIETASALHRLQDRGVVPRVRLEMGATFGPDAPSANVVGEVRGRERPEDVVVLGCHLDSWDVGQGAQDDGAGCAIVMAAADLLNGLEVKPRRTVRVVLFTNEENGLAGGKAYRDAHAGEPIVAALEVDTGAGQPLGVGVGLPTEDPAALAAWHEVLRPWAARLGPIGAGALSDHGYGADVAPLAQQRGIPIVMIEQDTTDYWPIHHTEADTFDKIDPVLLARNVAATAVVAYALADAPTLPPPLPPPAR